MKNNLFERITNIRQLNYDKLISQTINDQLQTIGKRDLTGFCKYLAYNIKTDLAEQGVNAKLLDLKNYSTVDHLSLIVEQDQKSYLIDPSYSQFCFQSNRQMIKGDFFDQKLKDKQIASQLVTKGYIKINQEQFDDYLNSFI